MAFARSTANKRLRRLDVSNQFETSDYADLSVALPEVELRPLSARYRT